MAHKKAPRGLPVDARPVSRETVLRQAFIFGRNSTAAKVLDLARENEEARFYYSPATRMYFLA